MNDVLTLQHKLQKHEYQMNMLQRLAGVYASMPRPNQIARVLVEIFMLEFNAQTSVVWFKAKYSDTFTPYYGGGIEKKVWAGWKLPAPNPFPQTHMLLLQPQWLDIQIATTAINPLLSSDSSYSPYYIPFEYNSSLLGFAILCIPQSCSIEDELNTLAVLAFQTAASLFNFQIFADLSEQRDELKYKVAELEKANEELLKMDRYKDEFLVITSHELRTPLTGVLGLIQLVLDGLYDDQEEMEQMLKDSYSSGTYLLKLLNDILDLAKIESGHLQIHARQILVEDAIAEVRSIINTIQKKTSVQVIWPQGLELLPEMLTDPGRFTQVLVNLISNAIKFTEKGSVSINVERDIGLIRFSVVDTGIGIPQENQDQLFQKFVQVETGRTRGFSGTGLGLVICRHLVELMGGTIALYSKGEGLGTTIAFTMPIA